MRVFISYSSKERELVQRLMADLQQLGHDVWLDDKDLAGGQDWWDAILGQIRSCDVVVAAVSSQWRSSKACQLECEYAAALHRHVLPVLVEPGASPALLPPDLARHQYVDYRDRTVDASLRLARAMSSGWSVPPLPNPLPTPPEAPISYLIRLGAVVRSDEPMTREHQLDVLAQLKGGLASGEDREQVVGVIAQFRRREDLLAFVAADIDAQLAATGTTTSTSAAWQQPGAPLSPPASSPQPAAPAAPQPAAPQTFQQPQHHQAYQPPQGVYQAPQGAYQQPHANQQPPYQQPVYQQPQPGYAQPAGGAWSSGAMAGFIVCALFCAIIPLVVGITNLKHPARNAQAKTLIWVSVGSMVLGILLYGAALSSSNSGSVLFAP